MIGIKYWWIHILLICMISYQPQLFANNEFPYKDELKDDISFWKSVFVSYGSNQYIIHDSENLEIIYKVVTFDTSISENIRQKRLDKIKRGIRETLQKLSEEIPDKGITSSQKYIVGLLGDSMKTEAYLKHRKNIRIQQGMRNKFKEGLEISLAYLPYIKKVFKEEGLPEELAYLPHIESSFNPLAKSRAGAAGMWQFMRNTARLYMQVNRVVDQRYDPIISTKAAAKLLGYNYRKIPDWALAITAYNYGLHGMKRAVKRHGLNYIDIRNTYNHRRFKFASRNFYPEFLAVVEIMNEIKIYFPEVTPRILPPKIAYKLKKATKMTMIAKKLALDLQDLKKLNPVYSYRIWRGWLAVPAEYYINLPAGTDLAGLDGNYDAKLPLEASYADHSTKNLQLTDQKSEKDIAKLETHNVKTVPEKTIYSQEIRWRKPGVINEITVQPEFLLSTLLNFNREDNNILAFDNMFSQLKYKLNIKNDYILVYSNETLGHYADWLNIRTNKLRKINGLVFGESIFHGQKVYLNFDKISKEMFLRKRISHHYSILKKYLNQKQFVHFINYEVHSGESVWDIARYRYKVPVEFLQYVNIGKDLNKIFPGDIIRIPILKSKYSMEETL